ncbi:MAG: type II secretion system protein N [Hyphomonadaceae bacterium]|nr:type II secretion system protein N [Hyphomonadaceae bacterium]
MMAIAGKLSSLSLRDAITVGCEVAAFSALGASLAWLMWAAVEPVGPMPAPSAESQQANTLAQLSQRLSRIPDGAMQGDAPASGVVASIDGFVLFGARAGLDGAGAAIIAVNGAPQAAFSVGDEITPGARLIRVAADHVEIDVNGRSVRLAFANIPDTGVSMAQARPAPSPSATTASFVNALSLQPADASGGRQGFKVMSEADLGALGASGLRPGDIILRINGTDVSGADLSAQAAQLQAGKSIEIVYERNGQTSTTRIGRPDQ